jgi:uncharacterized protein CbrC (UPF0167 family)
MVDAERRVGGGGESVVFRYFLQPHAFSTYTSDPKECHFCHRDRPGYEGPFYGVADIEFVCEACLATGRLAETDSFTNEGDREQLRRGVVQLRPEWELSTVESYCQERTRELEQRTPHLVTWQDFVWPAHCDDYCRVVKEVGKPDLIRLAPDGDGPQFLTSHLRDFSEREGQSLWEFVRPDSPQDGSVAYSAGFYLFECLRCGEFTILWDAD